MLSTCQSTVSEHSNFTGKMCLKNNSNVYYSRNSYLWNQTAQHFEFTDGEPLLRATDAGEERVEVKYPPFVKVMRTLDGSLHPVVYSANGSHGLWSEAGTTPILIAPNLLNDDDVISRKFYLFESSQINGLHQ